MPHTHAHNISTSSVSSTSSNVREPLRPYGNLHPGAAAPEYISLQPSTNNPNAFKATNMNLARATGRTPSPTPSEINALKVPEPGRWKKKEFWLNKKMITRLVLIAILIAGIIVFDHYKEQIIKAIEPTADKLKDMTAGWLIPVAIFVAISFPPLFGHEFLALLLGFTFGFWEAFGITALGTILGDIANFIVFRFFCRARGEKFEQKNISYAVTATVLREGGLKIALMARYSFLPGHLITTIFSTCGTNFLWYLIACVLSLPKQASIVIVGTTMQEEAEGTETRKDKIINAVVIVVMTIISIHSMRYMKKEMDRVKPQVIYNRRKARQYRLEGQKADGDVELGSGLRAPTPQRVSPAPPQFAMPQSQTPTPPTYRYDPPQGPPPGQAYGQYSGYGRA